MSNNIPLFKVGELVGLVSVSSPECNGQYIIDRVLIPEELYNSRTDGTLLRNGGGGFGYLLDKSFVSKFGIGECCWDESALRKIHKISDYSYDQLLTELKNTDKITSPA